MASGYVYWLPTDHLSVAFEPRYHDFELGDSFDQMRLTELPLSLRYFSPAGWRFGLTATAVEQDGEFDDPFGGVFPGSDSFWLLDAIVAYRFPRRMGTISLEGTNLLDEEFQFQETDLSLLPRYIPEAQVRLRFSLNF
jgi:outer membrane receptor protein involved in Fe transport